MVFEPLGCQKKKKERESKENSSFGYRDQNHFLPNLSMRVVSAILVLVRWRAVSWIRGLQLEVCLAEFH